MAKTFDTDNQIPTWSAHNSISTSSETISSKFVTPILYGSPTDWSNLYTALKLVQGINVTTTTNHKTIVSLDLQLYSKCIQLQDNDTIRDQFIFRLGELHILFAMLKVIGKYINGSGLDEAMIEAGIYGPTTMEQIKKGKHYKRSFEAFLKIFIALFKIYAREFFEEKVILKVATKEIVSSYLEGSDNEFTELVDQLVNSNVFTSLEQFDKKIIGQGKFLRNYMRMFEIMLLFIRATRQSKWELHLTSLNMFTKYFFAHDQINYARLTPVYLSDMFSLKTKDQRSWEFLKSGNFCVNKSKVPFCSLGVDHALEQENKEMKAIGGIRGIAHQTKLLEDFFLASPLLSKVSDDFCDYFNTKTKVTDVHYQLLGSTNTRYHNDVQKLTVVYENHDLTFVDSADVFNIITKSVLPENKAEMFLNHDRIGEELYLKFRLERLQGEKSVWEPTVKRNLPTFTDTKKTYNMKIADKIIQLKDEKRLMTKFIVASRRREDIDLPYYFGKYEFAVVPRSLFQPDGSLLLGNVTFLLYITKPCKMESGVCTRLRIFFLKSHNFVNMV